MSRSGSLLVMANGCFDLLHAGHVRYLQRAAAMGDRFIVAINDDDSVRELKGPGRPFMPAVDRAFLLSQLRFVDEVFLYESEDRLRQLVLALRPHVLVKGEDYKDVFETGRAEVESYGGRMGYLPRTEGVSTTELAHSIASWVARSEGRSDARDGSLLHGHDDGATSSGRDAEAPEGRDALSGLHEERDT